MLYISSDQLQMHSNQIQQSFLSLQIEYLAKEYVLSVFNLCSTRLTDNN